MSRGIAPLSRNLAPMLRGITPMLRGNVALYQIAVANLRYSAPLQSHFCASG
jgi:hypothetical protein